MINENESAKLEEKIELVRIAVHALFNTVNGFVWKAKVASKVEHSTLHQLQASILSYISI